uniref:Ig-like domain-containing protein n=1 Tax=Electrophorus electricus TaxID=8005 RepID=A0A4W4E1J7_ELEEL
MKSGVFILWKPLLKKSACASLHVYYSYCDSYCVFLSDIATGISVIQSETLQKYVPGGTITLKCIISKYYENYFSWFRQSLGEAPTCIINLYAGSLPVFHGDFTHDRRYKVNKSETQFTLTISDLKQADTGIYYCAVRDYDLVVFSNGVFLKYEDNNLILKETVHPGDSVTLQCTVLTESCAGEHSVYWFRHGSGESHPGIIYTHGDSSDQCKKSSEVGSPTQTCVFNLPKSNLSLSDAGTYYCAVAMCGEILFGNGSKLEFVGEQKHEPKLIQIIGLATSNVFCLIIISALLCMRIKTRNMTIKQQVSGKCLLFLKLAHNNCNTVRIY